MTDFKRCFELLGLPYGASDEAVRAAYQKVTAEIQAKEDAATGQAAERWKERLRVVDEAYMTLIGAAWQDELAKRDSGGGRLDTSELTVALHHAQEEAIQKAMEAREKEMVETGQRDTLLEKALAEAQEEALRRATEDDGESLQVAEETVPLPPVEIQTSPPDPLAGASAQSGGTGSLRIMIAACLFAVWTALSVVLPFETRWTQKEYEDFNKTEWTLEKKHKKLYDEWVGYQEEKVEVLSQLLGRKVEFWEADKWRPPFSLTDFSPEPPRE